MVRILSRRERRRDLVGEKNITTIYTDGFKMDYGVWTGVYCEGLPNSASIFQAEVLGIAKACGVLRTTTGKYRKLSFTQIARRHYKPYPIQSGLRIRNGPAFLCGHGLSTRQNSVATTTSLAVSSSLANKAKPASLAGQLDFP